MNWAPIWALPNIEIDEPVESDFLALVPSSDQRVRRLKRQHRQFRCFMDRFYDTFKNRIHPTLIVSRTDAPAHMRDAEVAASFRDLLVASMVPYARSQNIVYDNSRNHATYSSFFWIYPWMIGRDYEHIIASTPAMLALHEPAAFKGQSSPDLSPVQIRRRDFDEPLLQELLRRWIARYGSSNPSWNNIALFRSLNMANQASLFPAGADATIHDYGRIIALWIAAFEILVHPGGNGNANLGKVFELLETVPWIDNRCAHRRYETGRKTQRVRRNIACWIYKQMYASRNDFLHGNPVGISQLWIRRSRRPMTSIAPVLYRLGLTSFLDLTWKDSPPPDDAEAIADFLNKRWNYTEPQRDMEKALLLSRITVQEQRRQRRALLDEYRRRIHVRP